MCWLGHYSSGGTLRDVAFCPELFSSLHSHIFFFSPLMVFWLYRMHGPHTIDVLAIWLFVCVFVYPVPPHPLRTQHPLIPFWVMIHVPSSDSNCSSAPLWVLWEWGSFLNSVLSLILDTQLETLFVSFINCVTLGKSLTTLEIVFLIFKFCKMS